ncbi:MAG TPA: ABC transporter permease [Puia sp.]|nr:ABC transporter permease [Puia sp.]
MFSNFLRIAIRSLQRHRTNSVINIAGLATGMAITLVIGLWIADECSFDHYHSNHSRIVQVMVRQDVTGNTLRHLIASGYTAMAGYTISTALGPAMRTGFDDIFEKTAMVTHYQSPSLLNVGDKAISCAGEWAQYTFPEIFGFRMLLGTTRALKDPSTVLISKSTATALFGHDNPLGKIIRRDAKSTFAVGGVYEDLPRNSTFYGTGLLLPWNMKEMRWLNQNTDWNDHSAAMYALLAPNVTPEQATARIKFLPTSHVNIPDAKEYLMTYPLDRIHLHGDFKFGVPDGGRIRFVWFFGLIGGFVLLLACINFMNLSTARSERRAKEVGIRKTIGSLRSQLIGQFLGESILFALIALSVAMLFARLSLPFFNSLSAKDMHLPVSDPVFWLYAIAFAIFTGILAGSYPAFYLSAFRPVKVLKGLFRAGRSATILRQVLVTLQFTISLSLVIGTIVVFRQIMFAKDRPLGYTREGLVTIPINTDTLRQHYDALRNELLASGVISNVAQSSLPTTGFLNGNPAKWKGQTEDQKMIMFNNVNVSPEFGPTVGWKVLQGRDLSRDYPTDSSAALLNAAAVRAMGIDDPVGRQIEFAPFGEPLKTYHIVGVVGDMLANSPYEAIGPAIFLGDGWLAEMTIRIRPGISAHTALAAMEKIFKKFNPASPFIYRFNDEDYAQKFAAESQIGSLGAVFAGLAIFISCLGLFGLASFMAEQRTREVGVRKVLGAGVFDVWVLLSMDFLKLVLLSLVISMPLVFYGMHRWLGSYPIHAPLSWWIFASAGAGILAITLLTVSYQSLKAAFMNPVHSLRVE